MKKSHKKWQTSEKKVTNWKKTLTCEKKWQKSENLGKKDTRLWKKSHKKWQISDKKSQTCKKNVTKSDKLGKNVTN